MDHASTVSFVREPYVFRTSSLIPMNTFFEQESLRLKHGPWYSTVRCQQP
jgi:hypothetical protein